MAMLSVKSAAAILGVSDETVRRWCASGRLKAFRPNGRCHYRIPTWAISNRILSMTPEQQHNLVEKLK